MVSEGAEIPNDSVGYYSDHGDCEYDVYDDMEPYQPEADAQGLNSCADVFTYPTLRSREEEPQVLQQVLKEENKEKGPCLADLIKFWRDTQCSMEVITGILDRLNTLDPVLEY